MKPDEFVAAVAPAAVTCMRATGIPASVTIAQAALESGWGSSRLAREGFNLFGVKADARWQGPTMALPTKEFVGGRPIGILAHWRRYSGWQQCIDDRAAFLRGNRRYAPAFAALPDALEFCRQLEACGYATDPDYSEKLAATISSHDLTRFDKEPT